MKLETWSAGVLLIVAGAACGGKYALYDGATQPAGSLAVLLSEDKFWGTNAMLRAVDGRRGPDLDGRYGSSFDGSFRIELLPGKHTLTIGYVDPGYGAGGAASVNDIELAFTAEAGHTYTLAVIADKARMTWSPVLTDTTTGVQVYP